VLVVETGFQDDLGRLMVLMAPPHLCRSAPKPLVRSQGRADSRARTRVRWIVPVAVVSTHDLERRDALV
jgi:hypothetical protein